MPTNLERWNSFSATNASQSEAKLAYDALNRVTNMADAVGTNRYTYTAWGALLSEDGPWADDTVTYAYKFHSTCVLILLLASFALAGENSTYRAGAKSPPGDEFFCDEKIRTFRIELAESALGELNRNERAYARARMSDGKRIYTDVGIHLKGMGSFQPLTQKPSFTVKLDRFVPGQRFLVLKKFMLNNSVQDPTFLAEWLSSQMFRDAGVPAPRATHAFVEFNGRPLGLYVLVEAVTSDFLTQHFKNGRGSLYEGYLQDIDQPLDQDGGADNGQQDLKKLLEICRIEDPVERWRRLPEVLDVDAYLAHCAVEMFIGHTDGYAMNRNNYRLYHDPVTGRFTMVPHGLDWGFASAGAPVHPPTTSIITHAVVGTPEGRRRYDERARQIFTNVFQLTVLSNRVNEATARLKAAARDPDEASRFQACGAEMLRRVTARHAFIASKLASGELSILDTVGKTDGTRSQVAP